MVQLPTPDEQFESGIAVTRYSAPTRTEGIYNDDSVETPLVIVASVQPMDGDTLLLFPEGERQREMLLVFTATLLRTVDEETNTPADTVTWNGHEYEVIKVRPYQMGALDHYECVIKRMTP
jgi:hypothetical protein